MAERARVVIVGGGITGCSLALHLVRAEWRDVLLLEKGELTSGSTCQAAGLVTAFNPSPTMMRLRRYSIELYGELGVFETVGSLRIASSRESLLDLRRGVSRARAIGLDVDLVGPDEVVERLPEATRANLHGAVWVERDGYLDPHTATHALAAAAREHGADIRTHVRVDAVERAPSGEIAAVHTAGGRIECEHLVVAAGIWAPRVAAMAGVWIPSVPVDHQHIALTAVPGHEWARDAPCFRDTDNLVYGKAESGGVLFGGYEPDPPARWLDGAPWEHGGRALPPDHERFALLMDGACRRFPALREAGVAALVCHPDAMTPDGNPLVGPVPGVPGLWMACGLSLNGFGGAGGIGRELTRLIVEGESELDLSSYRPWRFGRVHRDPLAASAAAREAYRYYYRLRYPADQDTMGRPRRLSPLHLRQAERGALFAAKHGWERPDHLRPGEPSRRAGEEQRAFGFAEPPWHARVGEEHRAIRERAGLIDMTSFGKLAVEGPGALPLLEHVCAARIDRPVGSVVYTQMLDADGRIVGDVTVTRLGGERFRMVTGAGAVDHDLGWLRLHEHGAGGANVELRDESDEWAVIGLWGPRSRDVLARAGADGVDAESLPFRRARQLALGGAIVLAQRITYVGELGFELYVPPAWAVEVWDRLAAAGEQDGLDVCGYRVLDGLRLEKGYRYLGTDLTASDTPDEAGLGALVAVDKGDFVGRDATLARRAAGPPARRLRTLLVGEGHVAAYGGEAVLLGGEVSGRLRSIAYGYSIGRTLATAYLRSEVAEGEQLAVEALGEEVAAEVAEDCLWDPSGARARA